MSAADRPCSFAATQTSVSIVFDHAVDDLPALGRELRKLVRRDPPHSYRDSAGLGLRDLGQLPSSLSVQTSCGQRPLELAQAVHAALKEMYARCKRHTSSAPEAIRQRNIRRRTRCLEAPRQAALRMLRTPPVPLRDTPEYLTRLRQDQEAAESREKSRLSLEWSGTPARVGKLDQSGTPARSRSNGRNGNPGENPDSGRDRPLRGIPDQDRFLPQGQPLHTAVPKAAHQASAALEAADDERAPFPAGAIAPVLNMMQQAMRAEALRLSLQHSAMQAEVPSGTAEADGLWPARPAKSGIHTLRASHAARQAGHSRLPLPHATPLLGAKDAAPALPLAAAKGAGRGNLLTQRANEQTDAFARPKIPLVPPLLLPADNTAKARESAWHRAGEESVRFPENPWDTPGATPGSTQNATQGWSLGAWFKEHFPWLTASQAFLDGFSQRAFSIGVETITSALRFVGGHIGTLTGGRLFADEYQFMQEVYRRILTLQIPEDFRLALDMALAHADRALRAKDAYQLGVATADLLCLTAIIFQPELAAPKSLLPADIKAALPRQSPARGASGLGRAPSPARPAPTKPGAPLTNSSVPKQPKPLTPSAQAKPALTEESVAGTPPPSPVTAKTAGAGAETTIDLPSAETATRPCAPPTSASYVAKRSLTYEILPHNPQNPGRGKLTYEKRPEHLMQKEMNVIENGFISKGYNVTAKKEAGQVGIKRQPTCDLIVEGLPNHAPSINLELYAPDKGNIDTILKQLRHKKRQASRILVDLSSSNLGIENMQEICARTFGKDMSQPITGIYFMLNNGDIIHFPYQ